MFGFSIPKLLLLFIIILLIWNLFRFLENKSKSRIRKERQSQYDEEALTECNQCGGFYDKSIKRNCPMCKNTINK